MATGLDSAGVALQTLRSKPLNTLLSTLGIVVGIAALVGILSFGDGMEQFARAQIMRNTDFQSIQVTTSTTRTVDGISTPRSYPVLSAGDIRELSSALGDSAEVTMLRRRGIVATAISEAGDTLSSGAIVNGTLPNVLSLGDARVAAGRFLSDDDVLAGASVAVLSDTLARRLSGADPADAVGRTVELGNAPAMVVGVLAKEGDRAGLAAFVPITSFPELNDPTVTPAVLARAAVIEQVPLVARAMERWFDLRFGADADALQVVTNERMVDQVSRGVLLFKVIMGLIVGLSVLVGGIGVMNVLLMSVTERTREIGIRKAAGARRGDIVAQFLLESIAISGLGCVIGLAFGAAVVLGSSPIIRRIAAVPFDAVLSPSTVVVVLTAAIILGLTFGTYPAWRASRLSPVDAIRHE